MSSGHSKQSLSKTIWNALALDANFYKNAHDTLRNHQLARTIVILAAVSRTLGNIVILLINRATIAILILALLIDIISFVGSYYFWTLTIWKIGKWLKPHHLKYEDLLSPIGFAYTPQVLNFLTLIPLLGQPIELGLSAWSLLAVIVAVRQSIDISTRWASLICLTGWSLIQVALGFIQLIEQVLVNHLGILLSSPQLFYPLS